MTSFSAFTPPKRPRNLPLIIISNLHSQDKSPTKPIIILTPRTPSTEVQSLTSLSSPLSSLSPLGFFPQTPNTHSPFPTNRNPFIFDSAISSNVELTNFLLNWKIQQNLQTQAFNAQMQQLMDIKSSLLEKMKKQQAELQERDSSPVNLTIQKDMTCETILKSENSVINENQGIREQIQKIVSFILENHGRISESQFESEKSRFKENLDLVEVFEMLVCKFNSAVKTKEEMVKYVLRRAFKFIKNNLKKKTSGNAKIVSKTICRQYFKASEDEISKLGDEDEFLKMVLPFRKNSKNKTMNMNFISEMFSSENFTRDYQCYLRKFNEILENDNQAKIDKLVNYIEECIRKKVVREIKNYKRIPWPKLWITNIKKVAEDLPKLSNQNFQSSNPLKKNFKEVNEQYPVIQN